MDSFAQHLLPCARHREGSGATAERNPDVMGPCPHNAHGLDAATEKREKSNRQSSTFTVMRAERSSGRDAAPQPERRCREDPGTLCCAPHPSLSVSKAS